MSIRRFITVAQDETAQGVVEFAFISTILLLIFLGTIDFGRFAYYDAAVRNSARTGVTMGMRHCSSAGNSCGQVSTPMADDVILHATVCEAQPYVQLDPPGFNSCSPCDPGACGGSCTGITDCNTTDVKITGSTSPRQRGGDITVSVGYNFHPLTFIMDAFFTNDSSLPWTTGCWSGDPAHTHTLCATYTGKIY